MYVRNGELVESEQINEFYPPRPQVKKVRKQDSEDSNFEDVTDSDDDPVLSQLKYKRHEPEDPRNRLYLEHYRET